MDSLDKAFKRVAITVIQRFVSAANSPAQLRVAGAA